jgi:tryptophanyl-tRNA synthetase
MGELERMTQYKEKSKQHEENINAGLFSYPVLMAADILLYKTDIVPVGEDQQQHVELSRTLARKFNSRFGKVFIEPKTQLSKAGARIMSLSDPSQKMSKSIPQGCVFLSDSPDTIRQKIKTAVTDSGKEIKFDEKNKPAISNLLNIYHLFSKKTIADIEKKYQDKGYAEFKKDLAEVIIEELKTFQDKRKQFEKNPQQVKKILAEGANKARKIAEKTISEAKKKMGLIS